jgi:hypothetical protein
MSTIDRTTRSTADELGLDAPTSEARRRIPLRLTVEMSEAR